MRDDFSKATKELLARRVGFLCSNPDCRKATSGPQDDPIGVVNLGVAAHITAASPGGDRYDKSLTSEQRIDSSNGIWLCQTCAKLIDNDAERFDIQTLESWKRSAERTAAVALTRSPVVGEDSQAAFAKAEKLMPVLLTEMREDLRAHSTTREFIVMSRKCTYNSSGRQVFVYYFQDHENLEGKCDILCNLGLADEITYNNVRRYIFDEELVDYLTG